MVVISEVTDKIKVFVSSRCGEPKYDEVRKELKELIEKTGLAKVYLFEDGLASTQTTEQTYLYALDDSDVCIFLIDNADGVTPAIVNEISRAKSQSKKSIYLFCNEIEKKPTQIQEELKGGKGFRYYVADSFKDFTTIGYGSLVNDINEIYRLYCKNRLIDQEFSDNGKVKIEVDSQVNESIKKNVLKGLDKTKDFMARQIYDTKREIKDTNEFDSFCEEFLQVIFGERSIREYNTSLLLDYLKKEQSDNLYTIVEIRWKAIQSYWQDDLTGCLEYLEDSLAKAKVIELPHWIVQDILIDLRNISTRQAEIRNKFFHQSDAQKKLDIMEEVLYYPLLDRYTNSLYEEIDKQKIKERTKSPYSVSFGNDIDVFADNIANIFVVAIFNGSLTHILLTLDRLKSVAFHFSEKYTDWQFRVSLLKTIIYKGNKKEVESYINTFNDVLGKMNAKDASEIYNFTKANPIKHLRSIAVLEAFKHLGYFFSDKDYEEIQKEIVLMVTKWIDDEDPTIIIGDHIFGAMKNNHLRMENDIIAQVCIDIISKKMYRYYDDVFELLSFIGLDKVNDQLSAKIIAEISELITDEAEYVKYRKLFSLIVSIRNTKEELSADFHESVIKHLPENDKRTYRLEVMKDSRENNIEHIPRFIGVINERNRTQGRNGTYSGYGNNPYQTILNIIKYDNTCLSRELAQSIFEAATDTLISEKQLISDKVSAIQLIVFIKNYCPDLIPNSYDLYTEVVKQEDIVINGHDGFLGNYSTTTLKFNYLLLRLAFNDANYRSVFEVLSGYNKQDEFENIEALKALGNLFDNSFCDRLDRTDLMIILQFVLIMCNEENHSNRYYSAKALLLMITADTEKPILTRLSQFMDFDSSFIKNLIMNQFDRLMVLNPNITKLMVQKASVDNHYVVREKGKVYLEKY